MMNKPIDYAQRHQALNETQSFIVQAPAGSGKTELLTQRFLVLLAKACQNPEEIIALTFTRKAAAEMRHRIMQALNHAHNNPEPILPHAKTTWLLAKQVLAADAQYDWRLMTNPSRLRIQTLDSLSARLTAMMPLASKLGGQTEIAAQPNLHYRQAARTLLADLETDKPWSQSLAKLLLYLDNNIQKVERLFVDMLSHRDQWLPYVLGHNPRQALEQSLQHIIEEHLTKLQHALTPYASAELMEIIHFAAKTLATNIPEQGYDDLQNLSDLPSTDSSSLQAWQNLVTLFITKDKSFRKKLTEREGFPAPSKAGNQEEKQLRTAMKQGMQNVIAQLAENGYLGRLLGETLELPPSSYNQQQWEIIESLVTVLPVLIAQLQVEFQAQLTLDYSEISLKALQALQQEDGPTDLALSLDYQIRHLLVDEFQDTSVTQYRLLEFLTESWHEGDGKTLFLVGDPMQSIYRFRKAEVALFLQAKYYGINQITLNSITLSVNFRSCPEIIEWVNQTFSQILPNTVDLNSGAIEYTASSVMGQSQGRKAVQCYPLIDSDDKGQAQQVVQVVQQLRQNDPEASVAIIVQARSHLFDIIPALQAANIPLRAVEIERLMNHMLIQDLLTLTQAMLQLADRVAWLALLRAPWCGLILEDLLIIADSDDQTIWQRLLEYQQLEISEDAKLRLDRTVPIIALFLHHKHRKPFALWLESLWYALGGPACVQHGHDIEIAAIYFEQLRQACVGDDLQDFSLFEARLSELCADAPALQENCVDIMTIHKSKGLEFDHVILPGLNKATRGDSHQLLLWHERTTDHGHTELILAPIKVTSVDAIYDYCRRQEQHKSRYELGRLLYVAATRAKFGLHMIANVQTQNDPEQGISCKIPSGSLLEQLWPALEENFREALNQQSELPANIDSETSQSNQKMLHRLSSQWQHPIIQAQDYDLSKALVRNPHPFYWQSDTPKHIGSAIHKLLFHIQQQSLTYWQALDKTTQTAICKNIFQNLGLAQTDTTLAVDTVLHAIGNTLNDAKGQWILKAHQQDKVEFPITYVDNGEIKHYIIDRTFVENDTRWIIDYKSAKIENDEDVENFLKKQKAQYAKQLNQYAKALQSMHQESSIKLGLYFPLMSEFIEWEYKV